MTDRTSEPLPRSDHDEKRSTGVARRHIIQGAAWSVPVIMVATTAPAYAAASTKPVTLAFNQPTYTATGCQTISGATVKATVDNGVPQAGISVSILLPNGYTFSGGSTTYTGVTNGSGVMSVPAIATPAWGGRQSLTALAAASGTTASATTNAQTEVAPSISGYGATNATQGSKLSSIPVGAVPLGSSYFLSGGDLYFENTKMASGVISAYVYANLTSALVSYNTNSGGNRAAGATVAESYSGVPTSATSVGADYYLTNAGALYYKGTQVATGVQSAVGSFRDSHYTVDYVDNSEAKYLMYEGVQQGSPVTFPTDSVVRVTALGGGYFLTGSGDLYFGDSKVASGVLSASEAYPKWYEHNAVNWSTPAGTYRANYGGLTASYPAVPPGSTALGADHFLSRSGDIYYQGAKVASGAVSAAAWERSKFSSVSWIDSAGVWRNGTAYTDGSASDNAWTLDSTVIQLGGVHSVPLGGGYFVTGGGDLYFGDSKVASGVLSASEAYPKWYEHNAVNWSTPAGTYRANYGGLTASYPAVPSGSTALGADHFLTPSGDIYYQGVKVASGAVSAAAWERSKFSSVSWIDSAGVWRNGTAYTDSDGSNAWTLDSTVIQVPKGSIAVSHWYVLSPSGDLYDIQKGATPILSGVSSAASWVDAQWLPRAAALCTDGKVRQVQIHDVNSTSSLTYTGGKVLREFYVLSAAGVLYQNDTSVASNVYSAQGMGNENVASIVLNNGTAQRATGTSVDATYSSVPFLPKAVSHWYVLSPSGDLYDIQKGATPILSGVSSAASWVDAQWLPRAAALCTDGKVRQVQIHDVNSTSSLTYTGGKVLREFYVLSAAGVLYQNDTSVASNVYSAQGMGNENVASIVLNNGATERATGTSVDATYTMIKSRPVSLGGGFVLTPAGDLYFDSTKVVSNISQARGWIASGTTPSASALGSDGKVRRVAWSGSATTTTLSTDFSGATVLRGGYMLTTSGILYYNDSQVSAGVLVAAGYQRSDSTASFTKYDC